MSILLSAQAIGAFSNTADRYNDTVFEYDPCSSGGANMDTRDACTSCITNSQVVNVHCHMNLTLYPRTRGLPSVRC